jgi:hypothetical protein
MMFAGTSRFEVLRLLGSGGMGSVYLVRDRHLQAEVALKTLNHADGEDLYRFKREFRSLADRRHPNLIALHELFCEDDLWFFTMEHVPGVPFDRYLRSSDAPPEPELLRRTLQQLCEGVCAIHEAGCIHRDLKPSNVLVMESGRVVILDFGLAKQAASRSLSGDGMSGTPAYMAPEQVLDHFCQPATDWYAVGSMLYEVLTGRLPFPGTVFEMLLKKQHEEPEDPLVLCPSADPAMAALCRRLLRIDPDRRPAGAEILARLGSADSQGGSVAVTQRSATQSPVHRVFGRAAELEVLQRAYAQARKGRLAVTLVQGTSGIGKTFLVETFLESLRSARPAASRPLVLSGRCHEREALPFKAFDGAVDAISRILGTLSAEDRAFVLPSGILRLAEVFPVLHQASIIEQGRYAMAPPDARESRNQAFVAFRELLARLGRLRPLVMFIDDLQWADRDSFVLLRALMQEPGAPALHLVLASRPSSDGGLGASRAPLQNVEAWPGVERVLLGPLPDQNIRELASERAADAALSAELKQRITHSVVEEAGGNPFFAVELVQHLLGTAPPDGERAPPGDTHGYRLDGMILQRVGGLPEEAQRMLEIIAVAGDPLPQRTLASAASVTFGSDAWERGLAALLDKRLLTRRGRQGEDTVVIYHDRIAEAVVRRLDEATQRKLHQRLAEAVERWDHERTDQLARYWLSAADHDRAKRYACTAAEEARSKLAFNAAAELYETALRLELDDQAKVELLGALGECRAGDGHAILAAEAYQRAAAASAPTQALRFHHLAAEQLLRGGHIAEGLKVVRGVLKDAGLRLAPGPRRAWFSVAWRLLWLRLRGTEFVERPPESIPAEKRRMLDVLWSVNIGLGVVDILRADDFLLRFLMLALELGDIRRVAQGLAVLAGQLAALGSSYLGLAMSLLGKAGVLAQRSNDPAIVGLATMCKGVVHYFAGEWELAHTELIAAEEHFLAHCHGVSWELATTRSFACFALRMSGRLRELGERFDRYTADADRTGDRYLATNLRTYLSIVWLMRNDCERARQDIAGLLDAWPSDLYQVQHFFHLFSRCEQALYCAEPERAMRAIAAEERRLRGSAMLKIRGVRVEHAWMCGRVALAMAERTSPEKRRPLLRRVMRSVRFLRKADHQTGVAMGAALEAGAHWLAPQREHQESLRKLERAVDTAEAAGAALLAAAGRYWLGTLLGDTRGGKLRARAHAWLSTQGVAEPERLAFMILPGFRRAEGDGR